MMALAAECITRYYKTVAGIAETGRIGKTELKGSAIELLIRQRFWCGMFWFTLPDRSCNMEYRAMERGRKDA